MFEYDDDAVEAMLAETRSVVPAEDYRDFEARVRQLQLDARGWGPTGVAARMRLSLMTRLRDLDDEQLAQVSWLVGAEMERRSDATNREEPE